MIVDGPPQNVSYDLDYFFLFLVKQTFKINKK